MDQQAIFIDAGFLLAVGGMQTAGTSLRSATTVNFEPLIEGIRKCTQEFSGLPTLRTYWYDASKDALFTEQHKRIGMISGVKVRLGRMSVDGTQKGVDLKLGLDLVGIARNRGVNTVFLLSGDDDLAEAVEAAQDFGVKVVLVGFEDSSHRLGVTSVAEHLALRVDSIITLPADLVRKCFSKQEKASPLSPVTSAAPALPAPPSVKAVAGAVAVNSAAQKPKPTAAVHPTASVPSFRAPRPDSPELVYSSGRSGTGAGYEDSAMGAAYDVGFAVAESWYNNTTQIALRELVAERPILPPEIDRVLLKDCASKIGEQKTDYQGIRKELRRAFWERLDQLA
ncbi:NYN domain-containing protein [Arthrobacter sp. zg-Y40]|uniref:NYN domain-containing protein n=1 Tax=Arthrobacter sp. zg-Y40 TaxID=2886939 RepID=UPI001D1341A2|nr:NYN domain-containing protein [Arthrobacter sp. zg-Y40]MCC3278154.1 NYN domain-containing protein [Arthrobacter sp. zg-Y40]